VLISDFYEGRNEQDLLEQVRLLAESGVRMIGGVWIASTLPRWP